MPKLNEGESLVSFEIGKGLNDVFSEITNCRVEPLVSDQGILQNEWKLTAREGVSRYCANNSEGPSNNKELFFFTGADGVRNCYLIQKNGLYKKNGTGMTQLLSGNSAYTMKYAIVKLPHTFVLAGTCPSDATGIEKIKVDTVNDTTPLANVGRYVMITGVTNPTDSDYATTDVYRNKYAYVSGYDSSNSEYVLEGLGNGTAIRSGAKYSMFDKLEDYILVYDDNPVIADCVESYYDGTAVEGRFSNRIRMLFDKYHGGNVIRKIMNYDGLTWVFSDKGMFRSDAKNYLFYPKTGAIQYAEKDVFVDSFVWKTRLIVGGKRSLISYSRLQGEDAYQPNVLSTQYGITEGGINDFEKDVYVLTSGRELIAFSENQYGVVLPTNVGRKVQRYLDTFLYSVRCGFDGRRFYMTGSTSYRGIGEVIVFDTKFSFWSVYQIANGVLSVAGEAGITYFAGYLGDVYFFDKNASVDISTGALYQRVMTETIDGGDAFVIKEYKRIELEVENSTQKFKITGDYSLNGSTSSKSKTVTLATVGTPSDMKIPRLIRYQLNGDTANLARIKIDNTSDLTKKFELRSLHVIIRNTKTDYLNTIYVA